MYGFLIYTYKEKQINICSQIAKNFTSEAYQNLKILFLHIHLFKEMKYEIWHSIPE